MPIPYDNVSNSMSEREYRSKLLQEQSVAIRPLTSAEEIKIFKDWCEDNLGHRLKIHPVYNILYGPMFGVCVVRRP